tara:strand:+ start:902 stop:1435 length:534 start_codon:yes stop_codon:yes gene_type:complete
MYLKSLKNCRLAIGNYPYFDYDASGGGGKASVIDNERGTSLLLKFHPNKFFIPPLNWKTTKILGLPMIPGIEINMILDKLEGILEPKNREIILAFEARFILKIFSTIEFPELIINTELKNGEITSKLYKIKGEKISENGKVKLGGIAIIPPTSNVFLNIFLGLPNEALAILECTIKT